MCELKSQYYSLSDGNMPDYLRLVFIGIAEGPFMVRNDPSARLFAESELICFSFEGQIFMLFDVLNVKLSIVLFRHPSKYGLQSPFFRIT